MSGRERRATRRELLRKIAGVGAVGVAGLAGCAGSGGDEPSFEEGFERGWREYAFEWTIPELSTDTLSLLVGTAVTWEADATHYVDDLSVRVEAR
ncbi:hypothetical protein C463_06657 [Halorubrum californiense DSM 19288]|uniref:Uncharacterized protein n=1 Tax=Halorubrum californiense DSM 19288 TaxID=1227465 RepID=M0EBU4_9EURY|nr:MULTISPECIES: hypothetical protein [Halorubrum]ELZ45281.1 hypothetical protein C463_06657 [Halorubrum californiense DSM 19288]TKX72133.1 hypothetical protein EXE40_05635 [Halorubrum sp. GN11GM_10-3_MGM]